jgi:hypothetical protein
MKYGKRYAYVFLIPIVVHLFLIPFSRYKNKAIQLDHASSLSPNSTSSKRRLIKE